MKLYSAILGISLGSFFSASAMKCGGEVIQKRQDENKFIRETLTQKNDQEKKYLIISKRENKETKALSYSGIIGDLFYDEKTSTYDILSGMNQTWLGDFDDKTSEDYKKLEQDWLKLQKQLES